MPPPRPEISEPSGPPLFPFLPFEDSSGTPVPKLGEPLPAARPPRATSANYFLSIVRYTSLAYSATGRGKLSRLRLSIGLAFSSFSKLPSILRFGISKDFTQKILVHSLSRSWCIRSRRYSRTSDGRLPARK